MKKIIYMISTLFYPSIGGVENHIYNLSKEMVDKGYTLKIINPVINLDKDIIYDLDGIEVHKISVGNETDEYRYKKYKEQSKGNILGYFNGYKRKSYYNKFYNKIYNYIETDIKKNKENKFIIHQHDFISSIKLSKKLSKKYKVIFTNHTGEFLFLKKLPMCNLIIKMLTYHFCYIIAPSNELADFKKIRPLDTFRFLSNGVDINKFNIISNEERQVLIKKHDIPNDKIIVFCPRRWAPTKGIIYLVRAINELINKRNIKNISFMFAGNDYIDYPNYRNEILNFIKENNLEEYIILKGNVNYTEVNELMNVADIVVLPSLMEAISLAALEAMAAGKIIIGTNVGGFLQIIKDKENGFLVQSKDENQLTCVLQEITSNLEKYNKIGLNARNFVVSKYSWTRICKETEKIYDLYWN